LEIVKEAAGAGHRFEWDPPASLTSLRGRWTCLWCGGAVLMRHDESCYGSAAGSDCVPQPKVGQVWESAERDMLGLRVKVVEDRGTEYVGEIVKVPRELASHHLVGQQLRIHRSRLRFPEAYKYGYKLIKDVPDAEGTS
jgi:hypothetical protein